MRSWRSLPLLLAAACAPEPDSGTPAPLSSIDCAAQPDVTWDNYAGAKLRTHCQGCHASTTTNRWGAPESVTLDSEADALAWRERIYVRVIEEQSMPPAGGLSPDELRLIEVFLACGL